MKRKIVFVEIGSTTTYSTLVDLDAENNIIELCGQAFSETTVQLDDISIGVQQAMAKLKTANANFSWDDIRACSSAGGGLRITVHGLMKEMTVKAAKESALGAGAIIKMVTAGKLRDYDIEIIKQIDPNLIIIAGGTDYGERETAIHNINTLMKEKISIPIIYCGNIENQQEVSNILRGQEHYIVDNVYPTVDEFNILPLRKQIQYTFEKNIIYNRGFGKIKEIISGTVLPTPGAVFYAAELLYDMIGDLLVIDVGGATTDIHSVCLEKPENRELHVSPEPLAKRTVEGDLGVFINREHVANHLENLDKSKLVFDWQTPFPHSAKETAEINTLSLKAAEIALLRHAGFFRETYNGDGGKIVLGKDLSKVKSIVLTGGALTQIQDVSSEIYYMIDLLAKRNPNLLLPQKIEKIYRDRNYILALAGYLSLEYKEISKTLLQKYLIQQHDLSTTFN